jgi:DNA topoisomerase-2
LAHALFPEDDLHVLTYLEEDGVFVEPEHFVPIIPLVLLNGCEGIGTGWMTSVP